MAADQFCLRWNNFQLNIASALDSLKTDEDLVDVTLSCEGQNVKAHKVVLSACSPYFRGVFKENPCQHPIVILKNVSYDDVCALLSFMYQGEVYITQDRLSSFLHTAELLQVRGLAGATNPFKDSPKQCKAKKPLLTSAGQLRHDTSPLSSPPAVSLPLQTCSKTAPLHPISKSPLMTLKEPHSSSFSLVQTKPTALNSSTTLHQHCSTVTQPSSYQHSTSIQYRNSATLDQSASYQLSSGSQQSQQSAFPQHQTLTVESSQQESDQPNRQSSSPQPPSAKRRKAFPRRVSVGGHVSTEESVEPPDAEKVKTKSSEEQIGCEVVSLGAAPVKQEPEDEAVFEVDATVEEESNPITFSNADDEVVQMESPASDVTRRLDYFGNVETVVSEEPVPDVKEEAMVEGGPSLTPHSMLLRSLSAAKHSAVVGDTSPSRLADGAAMTRTGDEADGESFKGHSNMEEVFGIPSWTANKTHNASDLFVLSESVSIVNRHLKSVERPALESTSQGAEVRPVYSSVVDRSRYYAAPNSAKQSVYQQRKHSWRSRRPVQCPNCQKIITMAYNLKSHLSTCLKRNWLRNKV